MSKHLPTSANVRTARHVGRGSFPHMGPADARVWREALRLNLVPADSYLYDVRLGGVAAGQVPESHELRQMWEVLMRKRVDVIARRGDLVSIIEVKPVGSFSALGQCLGYGYLWSKEKGEGVKPRLVVVCALCDPDLRPVFALYGVEVLTLPAASLPVVFPGH